MSQAKEPSNGKAFSPQMPKNPTPEALAVSFDDNDPIFSRDIPIEQGKVQVENKAGEVKDVKQTLPELPKEEGKAVVSDKPIIEEGDKNAIEHEEQKTDSDIASKKTADTDKVSKEKQYIKPPKKEDKKDEPTAKEGEKKEIITKLIPQAKTEGHFDYTGYSAQEQEYLKNMSRPAREYSAKLMKEHKELSKLKEFNYYQAPDAYQLSPDFKALQTDALFAKKEGDFWSEQLSLIKQGKPFSALKGWKNGQPDMQDGIKPTDQSEEQVRQLMNQSYGLVQQVSTKMQEYPKRYQQTMETDLRAIETERQQRFPWVADPTMEEHSITVKGMGDVPIKQVKENMAALFPSYMRSHPAVKIVGDMMVAYHIMNNMLEDAQNSSQVNEIKIAEVKRGEPSSSIKPLSQGNVDAKYGVREFDMSGMPE